MATGWCTSASWGPTPSTTSSMRRRFEEQRMDVKLIKTDEDYRATLREIESLMKLPGRSEAAWGASRDRRGGAGGPPAGDRASAARRAGGRGSASQWALSWASESPPSDAARRPGRRVAATGGTTGPGAPQAAVKALN